MGKLTKARRQDIIYEYLRGKDQDSSLSASEIHQRLVAEQIDIDLRSVRRDLTELSETHGLVSTDSRPERFYSSKDFSLKYKLELSESSLQVLMIALNNLKQTSHEYFHDLTTEAETAILNSLGESFQEELRETKERYYYSYGSSGKPESTSLKDFDKIMQAIRKNKVFTCKNNSPYKDKDYNERRRKFAPYIFILNSGAPYIIAKDMDDLKFKKLRMTRITEVRLTPSTFEPTDIDQINLEGMIGGYGGLDEPIVDIVIQCSNIVATYFKENIIHQSQVIEKKDDHYLVKLRCSKSKELGRVIKSWGKEIYSTTPGFDKD
jgi:predicted DNA-binding transcriptional regulator YafY